MTSPNARKQLSNVWRAAAEDLMAMTESELDAELKELGIDPEAAVQKGKNAVDQANAQARSVQRARLRQQMEAARDKPSLARDPGVTVEIARERLIQMQAANDTRLTLAARKRDPKELSDEEALALYWQLQELTR